MPFRFVDLENRPSGYGDFARRKRATSLVEQFCICLTVILTGIAVILLIDQPWALAAILFTIVGLAAVYVNYHTYLSRELVLKTEFQNALFAAALASDCDFCLIVRQSDGAIVYGSPDFSAYFGHLAPDNTIGQCLASAALRADAAERFPVNLREGQSATFAAVLTGRDNRDYDLRIDLRPLRRPVGYSVIRCREGTAAGL